MATACTRDVGEEQGTITFSIDEDTADIVVVGAGVLDKEKLQEALRQVEETAPTFTIRGLSEAQPLLLPEDCAEMFCDELELAEELIFEHVDSSQVTNMSGMFLNSGFGSITLDRLDTSNVVDMSHMFEECRTLNLPIEDWDVSSVTTMAAMFQESEVEELDLSRWDVSSVTDMSYMFSYAELNRFDISGWDTSSVTTMKEMFAGTDIYHLVHEDEGFSFFDMNSVEDATDMFIDYNGPEPFIGDDYEDDDED